MDISNAKSLHSLYKLDDFFRVATAACRRRRHRHHHHHRFCTCHHHRCDVPLAWNGQIIEWILFSCFYCLTLYVFMFCNENHVTQTHSLRSTYKHTPFRQLQLRNISLTFLCAYIFVLYGCVCVLACIV